MVKEQRGGLMSAPLTGFFNRLGSGAPFRHCRRGYHLASRQIAYDVKVPVGAAAGEDLVREDRTGVAVQGDRGADSLDSRALAGAICDGRGRVVCFSGPQQGVLAGHYGQEQSGGEHECRGSHSVQRLEQGALSGDGGQGQRDSGDDRVQPHHPCVHYIVSSLRSVSQACLAGFSPECAGFLAGE